LRIIYDGVWYHVMNRGRRGEEIFSGVGEYQAFIDLLQESCRMLDPNKGRQLSASKQCCFESCK